MPPWFSTYLPQATSDDLELRNCYADGAYNEDKIITLIEIYVGLEGLGGFGDLV